METQRLLLYLALGFLSLIIYQTWLQDYRTPVPVTTNSTNSPAATEAAAPVSTADSAVPASDDVPAGTAPAATPVVEVAPEASRIHVKTDVMDVELGTTGGTVLSVKLLDYPVTVEKSDIPFSLLSDDPAHFLVAESGLQASGEGAAPNHNTVMQTEASSYDLSDGDGTLSVPFVWKSDSGVSVTKTLTFSRGSYEIDVDYQIENNSSTDLVIRQYRQLKRKPDTKDERQQFVYTYIGGVVSNPEDRYTKVDFDDMEDADLDQPATDGWVAMIQHYFAAAWIPQAGEPNTAYTLHPSANRYVIGLKSEYITIPAGGQDSFVTKSFTGPKIQDKLAAAAPYLELTVDYGWLTIIAQPLFWLLKTIHGFVGNWGWAIIFTTFVIKAVFYKLSEASYRSMARMKKLQPKMAALKERYGDDRAKMGQATMEMYKKEKVNPLGGCLPMIVQIPVFIALYWTLLESVELRQAPWLLWIEDLSIRDPLFILPVLMAGTMYFQQKLNPAPVDPIQAKVFQFLPLIFGVFFMFFPAGLVLYWVVNNSLSMAQQYYITRHVLAENPNKAKA